MRRTLQAQEPAQVRRVQAARPAAESVQPVARSWEFQQPLRLLWPL